MSLQIRLATQEDSPDVVSVVKTVFDEFGFTWEQEGYHADLYDLDGFYIQLGDPFWVGLWDGKIVATCALELFDRIPGAPGEKTLLKGKVRAAGSDCSLERLYVHPKGRKKGIGAALFETTIREAKSRGRSCMEIWSDKEFGDAHRLYERFGARMLGDRVCDDPDEAEEWGLVLEL